MNNWQSDYQAALAEVKQASKSKNTQLNYKKRWILFNRWLDHKGFELKDIQAEQIVQYLIEMANRKVNPLSLNTLILSRSAIIYYWKKNNLPGDPAHEKIVGEVLSGLTRLQGGLSPRKVKALRAENLKDILDLIGDKDDITSIRNASILSLGFSAALRRSEICNLQFEDIIEEKQGLSIILRKSKTDQEGAGQKIAVINGNNIKPVDRLNKWINKSKINEGYLFQSFTMGRQPRSGGKPSGNRIDDGEIAKIVKKYVKLIGLDPSEYSGHSLRAGFVTSAAANQARIDKIMEVTRHKNPATLMRYIRDENKFEDHAGNSFI